MLKTLKYVIGILALPLAVGFSRAFYVKLVNLPYLDTRMHYFLWGIIAYMLMHILLYKPVYLYTLGHEAVHVLATWLCGGHVRSFAVSRSGGSVSTSKSNFFIELSPYFVPTYTLLLIALLPLIRSKLAMPRFLTLYIFVLGFTFGMHLIMTAEVLKIKQPDITKSGYAFSLVLIYLANLLLVFSIIAVFTAELTFKSYALKGLEYAKDLYLSLGRRFFA